MPNGYIDPYTSAGSLGGLGIEDLYTTYSQYGNLMGDATEGFEIAGKEFGLEAYDFTQEGILRDKYREDYKDFTRSTENIYSKAETDREKLTGQIGRAGFAGGGRSMVDFQADIGTEIKDLRLGIKDQRLSLVEDISDIRDEYSEGVYNTYMTYLSANPEDMPDSSEITDCYAKGQIYDKEEGCIDLGELPDDWLESDTEDIDFMSEGQAIDYDLEPRPGESWENFCARVGNSVEMCMKFNEDI